MIIKGESDDATYCTFISRTADYAWIRKCQRDLASENEWYFNILIAAGIFTVFITGRLTVYSLAACGVLWQRTLCWRCFEHCTRRQQIWLLQHSTGRGLSVTHWSTPSQCSTPPLVSCFRQDGQNMWLHFSATFIGWRSRKESSSVSVFWHIGVYMEPRRHTLPRHYNRPPTCLHVVIFGLPQGRCWSSLRPIVQHLATERFLCLAAARVWNSLPSSLRAVQSLTTFRRRLKAKLFESSFT